MLTAFSHRSFCALGLALLITAPLSGCVGAAIGAGAAVGVAAAQEGGLRGASADTAIRVQIADLWLKHDVHLFRRLDMTVKEGRVLITGNVPSADARVDAIRLAWQADGVKQVINEINVDNSAGVSAYATDVWITGQLKSKLLFDKYIQSINYTVDTVNGTVYLMGVAQDQKELDRVINHARNLGRVKNVVSYVRLRGETPAGLQNPTGRSGAVAPRQPAPVRYGDAGGNDGSAGGWTDTTSNVSTLSQDRSVTSESLPPPR